MSMSLLAALALVGAGVATGPDHGEDPGAYLAEKDGRKVLKAPLTLREEQAGIAGTTGTEWTIEPSGRWTVSRIGPDQGKTRRVTTVRSGTLTAAQVEALAAALAAQDLSGLPEKTGTEAKVNPRRLTIKFGQKTASLTGVPPRRNLSIAENLRKSAPAEPQAGAGIWARFAHVAQVVETHCRAAEQP
jgi:hypothetical protein